MVDGPAFENMKDGAIVCNSGHFDSEINLEWLEDHATKKEEIKPLVEEYTLPDGRTVIVLAQGRLVNLSCAEGHPASVMDMSFANQALAAEYLYLHAGELENKVYDVPAAHRYARGAREAGNAGHRDRHAHRGADQVHELLELRDAVGSDEGSPFPAGKEPGA